MPTGEGATTKVFLATKNDSFVIFVESADIVKKWRKDRSIPLAEVVNGFKIFTTHKYVAVSLPDRIVKWLWLFRWFFSVVVCDL